jgi:DNA-binding CsgD family transcriptional regulator
VTILTYPVEWVSRYLGEKYETIDPVVSVAAHGILPTDWSSFARRSAKVRTLFGEAREHGVGQHGMTIPLRGRFGEIALFSFTSDESEDVWTELKRLTLPALHVASFLVHQRALDLTVKPNHSRAPILSPRELDCLKYLAAGMRDRQIADTLKISGSVVWAYVESMRHKLGASTRAHAVSIGIKLSIISSDLG